MYTKHVDVRTERELSNEVNLEQMFQEKLPAEACEIKDFLHDLKNSKKGKEFDIPETKTKLFGIYEKGVAMKPERLDAWLMAHESVQKPLRDQ